MWTTAAAIAVLTAVPVRAGSDDERMCKQGCEEQLTSCKAGCQNERDSGDQQETDRYRGCDADCHSQYASCKGDCASE